MLQQTRLRSATPAPLLQGSTGVTSRIRLLTVPCKIAPPLHDCIYWYDPCLPLRAPAQARFPSACALDAEHNPRSMDVAEVQCLILRGSPVHRRRTLRKIGHSSSTSRPSHLPQPPPGAREDVGDDIHDTVRPQESSGGGDRGFPTPHAAPQRIRILALSQVRRRITRRCPWCARRGRGTRARRANTFDIPFEAAVCAASTPFHGLPPVPAL
ncbi:hypothetical protein B0H16DRAFT_1889470 [Mycena metata]|uniref:Uncharacterized protein n=1 Tax=Mycena metata TaxID=1033252 RepID=A0AAD7N4F0_9AGAR|nr:hypothetical protein B0H16DRAFT_1889470 [Mycena metata]